MEVYILDTNRTQVCVIDVYKSLIWTKRYYEPGDFELYLPADDELLNYLKEDYLVTREDDDTVMIIEKIQMTTDVESGDFFIVTGRSLESILDRRIIWDMTIQLHVSVDEYIYRVIADNAINPTIAARKIPDFIFQQSSVAMQQIMSKQATGTNLLAEVNEVCKTYELGFRIYLNDLKQFIFQMYKGNDVSDVVVFSPEFDNLINSQYLYDKTSLANMAKVGGEGEGNQRKYTTVSRGNATGLDRREIFVDAKNISTNTDQTISINEYYSMLQQKGIEELDKHKIKTDFSATIEPTTTYTYKEDYKLGDIVTITNEYGITAKPRIIEIIESWDDTGHTVIPTFEKLEV